MDDEAVFGPVLHRLSVRRGNRARPALRLPGRRRRRRRRDVPQPGPSAASSSPATARRSPTHAPWPGRSHSPRAMRKYDLHRVITFHGRVKAAREFSAEMPDVIAWMPARARPTGALWSEHVSGAMTERPPRPAAAALPQSRAERARPAQQRPLPRRGRGCADHRRCRVHRPAPFDHRHHPGRRQGDPQGPRQEARHHRVAGVPLRRTRTPSRCSTSRRSRRLGRPQGAARARRGARRGARRASPRLGARRAPPRGDRPRSSSTFPRAGRGPVHPGFQRAPRRADDRLVGVLLRAAWRGSSSARATPGSRKVTARTATGSACGWRCNARRIEGEGSTRSVALGWKRCRAGPGSARDCLGGAASPGCEEFVAREGHARVPQGHREDGYRLGQWVTKQRQAHRDGTRPGASRPAGGATGLDVGPA